MQGLDHQLSTVAWSLPKSAVEVLFPGEAKEQARPLASGVEPGSPPLLEVPSTFTSPLPVEETAEAESHEEIF